MKSLFIAVGALFAATGLAAPVAPEYVAKEVLVKFKPNSAYAKAMAVNLMDGQIVEELSFIGWTRVRYTSGYTVPAAVQMLKGFSEVLYAEPNYIKKLMHTPNDPRFALEQLGMKKTKVEQAWDIGKGSSTVIVAVIDTGVQLNHPDLAAKLVPGFDYSDNDNDPTDNDGHGTHCAGNVGANTNNAVGVAGAGYNVRVMPLKIFPNANLSVVVNAVKHAADNGAKVLSMSYGSYGFSQAEQDSMNYAWNKGCVNVAAAGNEATNQKLYPASYDNVISVAATNDQDQQQSWSNYGPHVDVAAAGLDVMSTYIGSGYARVTGTSMSTPIVAGICGLLVAHGGPAATNAQVRDALQNNTDSVGAGWISKGRVNAFKAMQAIQIPVQIDSFPSTISIYQGSSSSGNLGSVLTSDNLLFQVNSMNSPLGQIAGATADFLIAGNMANNISLKMTVEHRGPIGGTAMVYLKNWNTGQFVHYKSFPASTSDRTDTFDIAPKSTYVSPGRVVSVIIRNTRSPRLSPNQPFALGIDFLKIQGMFFQ